VKVKIDELDDLVDKTRVVSQFKTCAVLRGDSNVEVARFKQSYLGFFNFGLLFLLFHGAQDFGHV